MLFEPFLPPDRIARHEAAGDWPCPGVSELLARRVAETPSRLFVVDGSVRLTFADFCERANRVAAGLMGIGIGAGDVVSWQLPSWWEAAAVSVAIDAIGAVSNPILPIYREQEVSFVIKQARTRVLMVPGTFRRFDYRELARNVRRDVDSLEHVVVVRDQPMPGMHSFETFLDATPSVQPRSPRSPHAVTGLFYTSGTTAEPKGVMHTASSLGAFARNNAKLGGGGPDDVSLLQFPLTHIGGIGPFIILPILIGSRVVYIDVWDPEHALALIEQEGVTSAGGPPAILQGLLAAKGFRPERVRSVRVAGTGAADVPPELIREVRRRFAPVSFRSYGLTECPMVTSGTGADPEDVCVHTDGRPGPGCHVRIVDDSGRPLPPGVEGEIEATGPQMCVGYVDSRLNAATFTSDGFLRTGDLGTMDPGGYVRVTGRKKDIIIRKGENLSAKAIEDVLYEHPAVADASVVGVPDPNSGERVCACVVMRDGVPALTLADLRAFMEERQIMRQKIPEQLEILPELPRNPTGKVLKYVLRERFGNRARS